jgi:hypothetical protein
MPDKIFIGNISKGLEQFYLPFNIDNDALPTLYNAYSWRGRIKRKRGTVTLGRLEIQLKSVADSTPPLNYQIGQLATLSGAGAASFNILSSPITGITNAVNAVVTVPHNLFALETPVTFSGVVGMTQINGLTGTVIARNIASKTITVNINSSGFSSYTSGGTVSIVSNGITPGSIELYDGTNTYTEHSPPNGTLIGSPAGSGTINYESGAITISAGAANGVVVGVASGATYSYYPGLPVMGLRNLTVGVTNSQYPLSIAFDTTFAYELNPSGMGYYDISYYKSSNNPVTWTGLNYQQFWTSNYQGSLWATNNVPGMRNAWVHACADQTGTTITMTLYNQADSAPLTTLLVDDYLWFNEGTGTTFSPNGQTGYISDASGSASGIYVVTFTASQTVSSYSADTALAQLLTSQATGTGDGIRWFDGDPTGGTGIPLGGNITGWVNFAPPLTAGITSIDDETPKKYYLVGALAIVPFKDRLLFFSPWIQASAKNNTPTPIQLNDVVIWSWNGTPYYSSLAPVNETSVVTAYYTDQTGFGGWLSAGINQNIVSVSNNEDVLLVGFTGKQTRFIYTSNDLYPFFFFIINSELGTSATFSSVTLDRGAVSLGQYGLILTAQTECQRIDLQIPDQIFQLNGMNNSVQRLSAGRDFYHEWIYFTFVPTSSQWEFPTQTLQYNYREESWAILYENFTAHGAFRSQSGYTWSNNPWNASLTPWAGINESWNSGVASPLFPSVIAGNPQGFVVTKGTGTGEAPTGAISQILNNGGLTQIYSSNHCVAENDYLYFSAAIGSTYLNGQIGQVDTIIDANNFTVDIPYQSGTYLGLGVYARLSQPLIQTKQFPAYWNEGRKVRLGAQKYLLDYTDEGQATLNISLSQDPTDAWNRGPIVPNNQSTNSSLIYSQTLFTCPESTNIGLTQFTQSVNNPSPIAEYQYQIWHRVNTSLIGDTFQVGITLNDAQMRNLTYAISEIAIHAMQFDIDRGPSLA